MSGGLDLVRDMSLGIVGATLAAYIVRRLHQPAVLGYVLSGVLLGGNLGFGLVTSAEGIELTSEIGLILLLFIIGLEINLRELARLGKAMVALGVVQFLVCALLGGVAFHFLGYANAEGRFDLLYVAVALALSSTLIVVKLLHDKVETSSVAGRLTIGVLVLQDVWAILFMAVQPNLRHPQVIGILRSIGLGLLLALLTFAVSKYLLPRLFRTAATDPELVLLSALAWCFTVCALAGLAGLSREMGALIAGVSIAAFPYGSDVISKIAGLRDFFVTLFFVSLGLKMPQPAAHLLWGALFAVAIVVITRLVSVIPTAAWLGQGLRTGTVTALNLAQISEFSLVIVALGANYGHVSQDVEMLVLTATLAAAVLGTYVIQFSDTLARPIVRGLEALGFRERGAAPVESGHPATPRDVVLLGCFREGLGLLDGLANEAPELRERVLVVDYNPALQAQIEPKGFRWVYADLANPDAFTHLHIEGAAVIVCSVGDMFLNGTSNARLLSHLRRLAPRAACIMTAEDRRGAELLVAGGASHVLVPGELAGAHLLRVLRQHLS